MSRLLTLWLVVMVALPGAPARIAPAFVHAQQSPTITCRTADASVYTGGQTDLIIEVHDVSDLNGYGLMLEYDSNLVESVDEAFTPGDFLGTEPDQISITTNYWGAGVAVLGVTRLDPNSSRSGSGELARARVKGVSAGTGTFSFTYVALTAADGSDIPVPLPESCSVEVKVRPPFMVWLAVMSAFLGTPVASAAVSAPVAIAPAAVAPVHAHAQQNPTITCRMAAASVKAGGQTDLIIEVHDVSDLNGYGFMLQYDPTLVQVVDETFTPGDFLGTEPDQISITTNYWVAGVAVLGVTRLDPNSSRSGSGELARARLEGVSAGSETFSFTYVALTAADGSDITVPLPEPCSVEVIGSVPTAEPSPTPTATPTATPTREPSTNTPEPPTATPTPVISPVVEVPSSTPLPTTTPSPTATVPSSSLLPPTGIPTIKQATPTSTPVSIVPGATQSPVVVSSPTVPVAAAVSATSTRASATAVTRPTGTPRPVSTALLIAQVNNTGKPAPAAPVANQVPDIMVWAGGASLLGAAGLAIALYVTWRRTRN